MSSHSFVENSDSNWRILVTATQKASVDEDLQRTINTRPRLSYEQFVEELKRSAQEGPDCKSTSFNAEKENSDAGVVTSDNVERKENIYNLGDWESDGDESTGKDENHNYSRIRLRGKRKHSYNTSGKLNAIPEGDECRLDANKNGVLGTDHEETEVHGHDEDCWESLSSSSDDKNFDDFSKNRKSPGDDENDDESPIRYKPYSNLTECLFRQYYPESSYSSQSTDRKFKDYNKGFKKHGQLPLEERLPLMDVLDALEDVNKVLKRGKITPRMERILEYKQDYPFTEGYEEEQLGWCPYIIYKIEKLFKRISSKQWPY